MTDDSRERDIQTAAADLANSLIYRDRYASIHLARLILAGEDNAYRQFAEAFAERLQRWPKKPDAGRRRDPGHACSGEGCHRRDERRRPVTSVLYTQVHCLRDGKVLLMKRNKEPNLGLWVAVLAENAHPLKDPPLRMNNPFGYSG